MAGDKDQMDQDAIAAQWEASLDSEDPAEAAEAAAANELSESMALQWAAMVEDGSRDFGNKASGERVLSQEEIDNLLGFTVGDVNLDDNSGIRAIIDSVNSLEAASAAAASGSCESSEASHCAAIASWSTGSLPAIVLIRVRY